MAAYYDRVKEAADAIRARVPDVPRVAVVLGSGLGDFAGRLADGVSMPYRGLPHWPRSGVIGHQGRLVVGTVRGRTFTKATTWGPSALPFAPSACSGSRT
jgi:purine-nucleoside phosphorylase